MCVICFSSVRFNVLGREERQQLHSKRSETGADKQKSGQKNSEDKEGR